MGTYSHLYVGDYPVFWTKSAVEPYIMTIFREMDKRVFERTVAERNQFTWSRLEDKERVETAFEYTNTVGVIKARLDIMGFSLERVRREFYEFKDYEIEELKYKAESGLGAGGLEPYWLEEQRLLEGSTFEDFLSAFKEIVEKGLRRSYASDDESPLLNHLLKYDGDIYCQFPSSDLRGFLRAFLEVFPDDALVTQDITDLVDAGYYDPEAAVCDLAISQLTYDYPVNEKIIILTEGSTDKNVLEKSLLLLYPHLFDYYSFMDFGVSNASGSAGTLVSTIKAFVGSGISNRVIAVFDNDTAAQVAMRGLKRTTIPENIKILRYPDIEIAKKYPTLGPGGTTELDINGLACGIELYFGVDVLTRDGQLVPIQWKGYDVTVNQYQGEIMRKQELQEAFFEKLSKCTSDPSLIAKTDWSSIRLVLSEIFHAFQ